MITPWGVFAPLRAQEATLRRGVRTTSAQACGLYPAVGASSLGSRGVIVGCERYSGRAVVFDPFILYGEGRLRLPAPHLLVLGKSGHGKSALIKTYVLRQLARRDRAFVILDAQGEGVAGEWAPIAAAVGVVPIRLTYGGAREGGIRVNPLDPVIPREHQERVLVSMVEITRGAPLGADAEFALSVALRRARELARRVGAAPTLSDVFAAVTAPQETRLGERRCSAEELTDWGLDAAFALRRLTHGDLAGLFDGPTSAGVDLTGRLVVFDLSLLPREGEAMPLLMAVIGAWLRFRWIAAGDSVKRTLVVEEAWHILSHRAVARLFDELLRYGRRLGLSVVAVMHHLSDAQIADSPEARSIIKLSATRVIYHVEGADADVIADYLELPRWAREAIKDPAHLCPPGNAIWSLPGHTQLVRHVRTPAEQALTDTNARMLENVRESSPIPVADPQAASPTSTRVAVDDTSARGARR